MVAGAESRRLAAWRAGRRRGRRRWPCAHSKSLYWFQGKIFLAFSPSLGFTESCLVSGSPRESRREVKVGGKGSTIFSHFFSPPMCIFPLKFLQSNRKVQVVVDGRRDPPFPAALISSGISWCHFFSEVAMQQPIILLGKTIRQPPN